MYPYRPSPSDPSDKLSGLVICSHESIGISKLSGANYEFRQVGSREHCTNSIRHCTVLYSSDKVCTALFSDINTLPRCNVKQLSLQGAQRFGREIYSSHLPTDNTLSRGTLQWHLLKAENRVCTRDSFSERGKMERTLHHPSR